MFSALLVGAAVWCLVPRSPSARQRDLFGAARERRTIDMRFVAALVVPIGASVVLGPPIGPLIGLALAPVAFRAVGRLESGAERRRAARLRLQLPTALDLMVAALEVGRPPVMAFALAADATPAPLGPDLALVASRLAVSADSQAVWRTVASDPALAQVGRAFSRAELSGMPVAQVGAGVAPELRRERRAHRREQSSKVGVRTAAPLGACFLPAFFLIGIVPTIIATFRTFSL